MSEDASLFDVLSSLVIIGLDLVAVSGTLLLLYHRVRPLQQWRSWLSTLWWAMLIVGLCAFLILMFRFGFHSPTSGVDRMMRVALLTALGPMCLAALTALFLKPR